MTIQLRNWVFIAAMFISVPTLGQDADPTQTAETAESVPIAEADVKNVDAITASAKRLELDTTSVTGNRELPKVLVIVPWKNPQLVELTGRPLASLVEEVLSPLDPDVFRREVNYYNSLNKADDETPAK